MSILKAFSNPETAKKYKMVKDHWNRKVAIPKVWKGPIQDIPPHAVEAYLKKGRNDIVAIEVNENPAQSKGTTAGAEKIVK